MKRILVTSFSILTLSFIAYAEDAVDESKLFSDTNTVVDNAEFKKQDLDAEANSKKVGVSGEITSVNSYLMKKKYFTGGRNDDDNIFDSYVLGDLFLDVRLPANVKSFGSFEGEYNARTEETDFAIKELFIDFNFAHAIYFRTGKQVLQWGRCYLWNPTDLINIEKKTFIEKTGNREGTYGLKAHVPFGTSFNIYGFANTVRSDNADRIAGAGRIEALFGETEIALSGWGKQGYHPVAGLDFATRLSRWTILGEASVSKGSNEMKPDTSGSMLTTSRDNEKIVSKASIDIGRLFDVGDQENKLSIRGEFFYNSDGYEKNYFNDDDVYMYDAPVTIDDGYGNKTTLPGGTVGAYLAGKGLYEQNYYSKYYAAVFTTVNKFIISDCSLNINMISNLSQRSYLFSSGIAYQDLNDLKLGLTVVTAFGKKNTEYTFSKNAATVQFEAGILF